MAVIVVDYSKETGKVWGGTKLQKGNWGAAGNDVTQQAIQAVMNYILHMKTTTDLEETLVFDEPFYKHGRKPYTIEITLKPVEK